MIWWHILLTAVIAKAIGRKLSEWAQDEDVKREWGELVEAIDKAYADGKLSLSEIADIAKEAKDVIKEILE